MLDRDHAPAGDPQASSKEPAVEASLTDGRRTLGRRQFLRYSGALAGAGGLAGTVAAGGLLTAPPAEARALHGQVPRRRASGLAGGSPVPGSPATHPIRPPAAPLAVRQPYLSTWLSDTTLPGTWETFWTGHVTAMGGITRIDGRSYMLAVPAP